MTSQLHLVSIGHHDLHTLGDKGFGEGQTYPACRTGHHGDPSS